MSNRIEAIEARFASAALKRKRGEALRRRGREDAAAQAFREAIEAYEEGLAAFEDTSWHGIEFESQSQTPASSAQIKAASLWAEGLGSKGGVHRRLDQYDEAVESYDKGARLEKRFKLASTYSQVNLVKNLLQADKKRMRLEDLNEEITRLATVLDAKLRTDAELSDRGWAWADLGDCLALAGDVEGAAEAYRNFIDKAPSHAPESTLMVLRGIADAIRETDPQAAGKLTQVVEALRRSFSTADKHAT